MNTVVTKFFERVISVVSSFPTFHKINMPKHLVRVEIPLLISLASTFICVGHIEIILNRP